MQHFPYGVAAVLACVTLGIALTRVLTSIGPNRAFAICGLPAVVGLAGFSTIEFIGESPKTVAIVPAALGVLSALSLMLLVRSLRRSATTE